MKRSDVSDTLRLAMVARTDALANRHLLMGILLMLYGIAEQLDVFENENGEDEK